MQPASEQEIKEVSDAWLASQAAGVHTDDWVMNWDYDRRHGGDYSSIWRFVLKLCEDVTADDRDTIEMIGAGPLYDFVKTWPEKALTSIEAEVATNPTLLKALSIVIGDRFIIDRIDGILARNNVRTKSGERYPLED